jgi:hypothetical protein
MHGGELEPEGVAALEGAAVPAALGQGGSASEQGRKEGVAADSRALIRLGFSPSGLLYRGAVIKNGRSGFAV